MDIVWDWLSHFLFTAIHLDLFFDCTYFILDICPPSYAPLRHIFTTFYVPGFTEKWGGLEFWLGLGISPNGRNSGIALGFTGDILHIHFRQLIYTLYEYFLCWAETDSQLCDGREIT